MNIVLIGMMGSGKTTVGRLLARKLKRKFYDSDKTIEEDSQRSVPDIFQTQGEDAFRALERQAILKLMSEDNAVIATGGGAALSEDNWKAFGQALVVWLKARPETLEARLKRGGSALRPLLKDFSLDRLSALNKERSPFYNRASLAVDTDQLEPEETADKIARLALQKS
jgi:shikimate kinase